jgi:hypothetical protein
MAIIGLVLMFVAAVWMFFDSGPYEAWLDVVVTGLFVIAIAIPALLWLTWRRNSDDARDDSHPSFRDWAVGDFNTLTGPVKGANATAEVLLPIAAVARGDDAAGIGVSHYRERRLILYAENASGHLPTFEIGDFDSTPTIGSADERAKHHPPSSAHGASRSCDHAPTTLGPWRRQISAKTSGRALLFRLRGSRKGYVDELPKIGSGECRARSWLDYLVLERP